MKPVDITGRKFGRLTVLSEHGHSNTGKRTWLCKCDCGVEKVIIGAAFTSGDTKSCGCQKAEESAKRLTTHGLRSRPEYKLWLQIKDRCNNPKNKCYPDYGGRGIEICQAWKDRFEQFYLDMGQRPDGLEIDRIDNSGNYEPSNCRWVTRTANMRNTRFNVKWTLNGETKCISEWAKELGTSCSTLHQRVHLLGWTIEKALTQPVVVGANQYS